jgi:tetratricopeptide (TPR) repeat protein
MIALPLLLALGASLPPAASQDTAAPRSSEVAALIVRGRAALAEQRADDAEELFVHAESLSGGSARVRMWIWRAWLQTGRVNEALNAVDQAETAGELPQSDLDYMRGMAFFFLGLTYVSENVGEPFTSEAFKDASEWLQAATSADSETYHDAWLPLAECAWHARRYEIGRHAAEQAQRLAPEDPRPTLLFGRILFQRYLALRADTPTLPETPDARTENVAALWSELVAALSALIARLEPPPDTVLDPNLRSFLADAWLQLGYAYEQEGELEAAADAFAASAVLWPSGVDYADVHGRFSADQFHALLESAAARAAEDFGPEAADDALLLWWLGWSRFAREDWAGAAEAYRRAATKWEP